MNPTISKWISLYGARVWIQPTDRMTNPQQIMVVFSGQGISMTMYADTLAGALDALESALIGREKEGQQ